MTLTVQFQTMLAMAGMGIWLGAAIDTYKRLVRPDKKWFWSLFAGDILFWLFHGLLVFVVLLNINEGVVRFYIFLAILSGYAAYQSLFQRLYQNLLEKLIRCVTAIYRLARQTIRIFLVRPIVLLVQLIIAFFKWLLGVVVAIGMFALSVIWVPIKWIISKIIPESYKQKIQKAMAVVKVWMNGLRRWLSRLRQWLSKDDDK